MRILRKAAKVLKWIGIVLLCLSLVFGIYSLANTGANWSSMKTQLEANQVQTNLLDRIHYDSAMFNAMAYASAHKTDSNRRTGVAAFFADFEKKAEQNADAVKAASLKDSLSYLSAGLDTEAFLARYETREEQQEQSRINAAITSLDSLAAPGAGKKKVPALKNATSCADTMAGLYAALTAEHGEAAGTYADYLETVLALITAQNNAGAGITSAGDFAATLSWEDYQAGLTELQNQEAVEEKTVLDLYAEFLEGDRSNAQTFVDACVAELTARYPSETAPENYIVAQALITSLENASYDGSWSGLQSTVKTAQTAAASASFSGFVLQHSDTLIAASDERAVIGFISLFWWLAARLWIWIFTGALLLVVYLIIIKVTDRILMKSVDTQKLVNTEDDVLLRVEHLCQYFRSGNYVTKAVDDVSFYIKKGEVFGLVGESGCGKTTTGRTIINLYDPTYGDVYFNGLRISSTMNGLPVYRRQKHAELKAAIEALKNAPQPLPQEELKAKIAELKAKTRQDILEAENNALQSYVEKSKSVELYRAKRKAELTSEYEQDMKSLTGQAAEERKARYETEMKVAGKENIMSRMQMIFQDPVASINPRMTVREIIAEGLKIRGVKDEKYINDRVNEMLNLVGLVPEHADRYPHEFSGGQKQRIGIARAIIMEPELIIADEPISALDVSIQAQVINLLNDLRDRMGLTIMFIAHNLSVVKYFSDRIGVMYFGHLVELAPSNELFEHPLHPYTRSLLSAIPYPDPHHEKTRKRIEYDPNRAHDYSVDKPVLREIVPGHFISCNEAEFAAYKKELGI